MKALVIVDLQFDFLPGGALAVPDGNAVIPVIRGLAASRAHDVIVATRDLHPPRTPHFEKWPTHCVRGTSGAALHPLAEAIAIAVYSKGLGEEDGYSGFDNPDFARNLRQLGVTELTICGLALDYCVRATALDAVSLGFKVNVPLTATRAVDPELSHRVVSELVMAGVNCGGEHG